MNILITGASKGIGRTIALEFIAAGYKNIFVTGRNEDLLKSIDAVSYCICDLSQNPDKLFDYIEKNKIDVLINNAGEYIYSPLDKMKDNDITRLLTTNLLAPCKLISKAIPYMKSQRWGRIINIGSISGVMGEANASIYSASKAGLLGLTKALALELAEYNITVNTINPGWVETDLGTGSIEESEFSKEEIIECIPQKRFVDPKEIAGLVKYLISDDSRGITGQGINICAGLSVGI